jgi:hypothetical protein
MRRTIIVVLALGAAGIAFALFSVRSTTSAHAAAVPSRRDLITSYLPEANLVFVGSLARIDFHDDMARLTTVPEYVALAPEPLSLSRSIRVDVLVPINRLFQCGRMTPIFARIHSVGNDTVTATYVGHLGELSHADDMLLLRNECASVMEEMRLERLRTRVNTGCDLVFAGRVVEVRDVVVGSNGTAPVGPGFGHDPLWKEAVIHVDRYLRGQPLIDGECVVRFASSMDVAWYRSPKFTEGDQAVVLCRLDDMTGSDTSLLGSGSVPAFLVTHPEEVRPLSDEALLRSLIGPG